MDAEKRRLQQAAIDKVPWKKWGPYLSERQWGTVREDYSENGSVWDNFPHDHARSRAYRWGEDGIAGICDDRGRLCFALALWNGNDPILKERMFGLSGPEANHGEDVKEYYYYLDCTPTHSYMKMLYKYPQSEFPYVELVRENGRRGKQQAEYELIDTGVFDHDRYFDVFVEYAKVKEDDILIKVTAHNRGDREAGLHLLPQLWFRNTWSFGLTRRKPRIDVAQDRLLRARLEDNQDYHLYCHQVGSLLFCENETNTARLFKSPSSPPYPKDAINDYVVHGRQEAVNPERVGTKAAIHYPMNLQPGASAEIRLRLSARCVSDPFGNVWWISKRLVEQPYD